MAAQPAPAPASEHEGKGEALQSVLSCSVCLEEWNAKRKPMSFPCLHSFCSECVDRLWIANANGNADDGGMRCPTCRFQCRRDQLKPNFALLGILDALAATGGRLGILDEEYRRKEEKEVKARERLRQEEEAKKEAAALFEKYRLQWRIDLTTTMNLGPHMDHARACLKFLRFVFLESFVVCALGYFVFCVNLPPGHASRAIL